MKKKGVGGTATVYACKHKLTKTVVAVKQIDLELLDISHESKRLDGLRREIQIMKLCRHKHLLPTFQSFVNSCYVYIVMPMMSFGVYMLVYILFIFARSCRDLLTNFFPEGLDESLVACIIKQVVKGLQYLHENGLLHRDIKAANLLLDGGTVILADFGVSNHLLASTTSEQGNPTLRRRRSFLGTPFFMAPEILQHHEYNQNVDIWALGISTLELATGWPPLCEHDASSVFSHVIHDPPPILESNDYSPACHDFIACCLRKRPTERISADEASYHPFLVQAPPPNYLDQFLQQLDWSSSGPYTNSLSDNNTIHPSFLYTSSSFASSSSVSLHITNHDYYHHYTNENNTDWDFSNHPPSPLSHKPLELLSFSPPPLPPLPTVTCYPPSLYDNDSLCDEHVPITPEEETSALSKPFVHDRMLLLNTPSDFHLF
ncbi:hypothetical protein INT45_006425 [Circinella minor]|uniref:Protein kinase domain-containing protein n=1 Tax=Circinella minor TaxID=1195481 RepID=A0A8H7VSD3_9FUNG|nr:hypothetical protein INT45_006425 [Circinella minor]